MNLSHAVAGRSREVESTRAFTPQHVSVDTIVEFPPSLPSSPYAWKRVLQDRIWSAKGPKGITARGILNLLVCHGDAHGRVWLSIPTLATKGGLGSLQTVRNALAALVKHGWLWAAPQTWSSLTAEQKAVSRPVPRRGDLGQAPHLYTILDGRGRPVTALGQGVAPNRPSLARVAKSGVEQAEDNPLQILEGPPPQILEGGPLSDLIPDLDPSETLPKDVSEQGAASAPGTHDFSKALEGKGDWGWLESWQLVVQAHASKTKGVYGLAPTEADMKRVERKAIGECLEGASTEVAAKLRSRGMERELGQLRKDIAERAVALYFRNDTPHLRKTKHALRDLPREFHARIIDAMQLILRESHDDAKSPRQTVVLEQEKPVTMKAEKSAKSWAEMDAARRQAEQELGKIFGAPLRPTSRPNLEPKAEKRENVSLREIRDAASSAPNERAKAEATPERPKASQPPRSQEREIAPPTVQRSIGRPGAPRWGALGPTPAKVRRVSRLLAEPEEVTESAEPHPRE